MSTPLSFPSFEIFLRRTESDSWLLSLVGQLDALTASAFRGTGDALPPQVRVEIDAADLAWCDSAGMQAIVAFAKSRDVRPVTLRDPCLSLSLLLRDVDVSGVLDVRDGRHTLAVAN